MRAEIISGCEPYGTRPCIAATAESRRFLRIGRTDMIKYWQQQITQAAADGAHLCIRGSGSKDFYGEQAAFDARVSTRDYAGIVDYDAAELVLSARCGTRLADIEAALSAQGQMLAFEPPYFGAHATVGGCIAAGLAGPRRPHAGAAKDFVLGAQLLDGQGQVLNFGGRVMKNVAGYDVSRLLAGSLGTLGLITEVSLKVLPQPLAQTTLQFHLPQMAALKKLNDWQGQPLPISGSLWAQDVLSVRLSGAKAAVTAAQSVLGGEALPPGEAAKLWYGLREQTQPFFTKRAAAERIWRISVPDTAPPLVLDGLLLLEWGGAQRWYRTDAPAAEIRSVAHKAGGHATVFRGPTRQGETVFTPLPPALMAIQRRLKQTFDPHNVFNYGRMYAGF